MLAEAETGGEPRAPRLKPRRRRRSRKRGGETCPKQAVGPRRRSRTRRLRRICNQRPIAPIGALASLGKLIRVRGERAATGQGRKLWQTS